MKTATLFKNGRSTQAVRIPKEYRLNATEVWIEKVGDCLVITPKPNSWEDFFNDPMMLSEDFDMAREQSQPQNRGNLFS